MRTNCFNIQGQCYFVWISLVGITMYTFILPSVTFCDRKLYCSRLFSSSSPPICTSHRSYEMNWINKKWTRGESITYLPKKHKRVVASLYGLPHSAAWFDKFFVFTLVLHRFFICINFWRIGTLSRDGDSGVWMRMGQCLAIHYLNQRSGCLLSLCAWRKYHVPCIRIPDPRSEIPDHTRRVYVTLHPLVLHPYSVVFACGWYSSMSYKQIPDIHVLIGRGLRILDSIHSAPSFSFLWSHLHPQYPI